MTTVNDDANGEAAAQVKVGILTGDATLARVLESLCVEQGTETTLISERLALSGAAQQEGVDAWLIDVRIASWTQQQMQVEGAKTVYLQLTARTDFGGGKIDPKHEKTAA